MGVGKGGVRLPWDRFFRIKMCPWMAEGCCRHGDLCNYAHSPGQLRPWLSLYKTKLCDAFKRGECINEECNFAHGAQELRHTTGYYKTELCQLSLAGSCPYGEVCRHAHGVEELRPKTQLGRRNIALFLGSQSQGTASKETTTGTEEEEGAVNGASLEGQRQTAYVAANSENQAELGRLLYISDQPRNLSRGKKTGDSGETCPDSARERSTVKHATVLRQKVNISTSQEESPEAAPEQRAVQQQQLLEDQKLEGDAMINGVATSASHHRKKTGGLRKCPKQQHDEEKQHQQDASIQQDQEQGSTSFQQSELSSQQQVLQHASAHIWRDIHLSLQMLEASSSRSCFGVPCGPPLSRSRGPQKLSGDTCFGTPGSLTPVWCLQNSPAQSVDDIGPTDYPSWPLGPPVHQPFPCATSRYGPPLGVPLLPKPPHNPGDSYKPAHCFAQCSVEPGKAIQGPQTLIPLSSRPLHYDNGILTVHPHQHHGHCQHSPCMCHCTAAHDSGEPFSGMSVHPLARPVLVTSAGGVGLGSVLGSPSICLLHSPSGCPTLRSNTAGDHCWHNGLSGPFFGGGAERIFFWMQQVPLRDLERATCVEKYED
ncbi:uncharacterized protein LOC34621929 [Cyclospora cayetanensis]|uniref:Uncharacterized protein LOC34621929 n=1 Tax=Cyclospora cayetanensis TaxID=88456 RepID=A0A6P6RYC6_9EIME|nr:uncharacterized protein LOC34621929 [Cyclospora cayetanensis]